MPEQESADTESGSAREAGQPRVVSDPKAMRALAHPVRLAILDAMRDEGELTATRAAQLLDESPGNMSWHLQTLAKYGYIVEAEGGKGRSRPWKIATGSNRISATEEDPGSLAAAEHLATTLLDRSFEQLQEWWRQHTDFGETWFDASFIAEGTSFLTPAELAEIGEQMRELRCKYDDRADPARRPADALPVHMVSFAHPMPRSTPPRR